MTDTPAQPPQDSKSTIADSSTSPPAPRKRRWLRWLMIGATVIALLLIVVVVLLPTIASSGPVRSLVLGQVSNALNGKVEAASWSVGWFSPVKVEGVKVYDDQGDVVLELDRLESEATLLRLIRGDLDFGKTVVDASATKIVLYPDGTTNLDRLAKTSPQAGQASKPKGKADTAITVPDLAIDLSLNLRGRVEIVDAAGVVTAVGQLHPGSGGTLKIANINQPIETDLKFSYDVTPAGKPTATPGTLAVSGTVDAIENNTVLSPERMAAKLKIGIVNNNLGAVEPFLKWAKIEDVRAGGIANAQFDADLQPGAAGGIAGRLDVADLLVAGPGMSDAYSARSVQVPVSVQRLVRDGALRVVLSIWPKTDDITVSIEGDLPEAGLLNLVARKPAGGTGRLTASVSAADLPALQRKFAKTLPLEKGVALRSGDVLAALTLDVMPDKLVLGTRTRLALAGTRDGKPIAIEPTTLGAAVTITDMADNAALARGLRDLAVNVAAPFAKVDLTGPSPATISGGGNIDLGKAREQVTQFFDLDGTEIAGMADFSIVSHQRQTLVAEAGATYDIKLTGNAAGLNVVVAKLPPLRLQKADLAATAVVRTDGGTTVQGISDASLSARAFDQGDKPLMNLAIKVPSADLAARRLAFELEDASVSDLPRAQKLAEPFVEAIKNSGIVVGNGALYLNGKGTIDLEARKVGLSVLNGSAPNLIVARNGRELLKRDTYRLGLSAMAQASEATVIDIASLTLDSALIKLASVGPVHVELAGGMPRGNGVLDITAVHLPVLSGILQGLSETPTPVITAGVFNGKATLASEPDKQASLRFDGKIVDLSIPEKGIEKESITLVAAGTVDAAFSQVTASANISGPWVSLVARNVSAQVPKEDTPLTQIVGNADLDVGVKDLAKAYAVASALVPNLKLPYAPTSGGVAITANVKGGEAVMDIKTSALALQNAQGRKFAFDRKASPSISLKAAISGGQQLEKITISQLNAAVEGATVTAAKPIVVEQLSTTARPTAELRVAGNVERLLALVQFLQNADKPMPYRGTLAGDLSIVSSEGHTATKLNANVDDFAVLNDAGQPVLTEKRLVVEGDIALASNGGQTDAKIYKLDLSMPQSKAANLVVRGSIADAGRQNKLAGVTLDFTGEGETLWPMIHAALSPELRAQYSKTTLQGPVIARFTAGGAYPMAEGMTWNASAKTLDLKGTLSAHKIDAYDDLGASIENFALLLTLRDGQLVTGDMDKKRGDPDRFAKPFAINKGFGDFGSIVVDTSDAQLPVSIGKGSRLFTDVRLNSVMAAQLGSLASVFFKDADRATGAVSLTVVECNRVPIADLLGATKKAKATFNYSVRDLRLNGPVPSTLASVLGWGDQGIVGNIDNGLLELRDGVVYQDTPIKLLKEIEERDPETGDKRKVDAQNEIRLKGGVDLESQNFRDYTMFLSDGLLPRDWRKANPNGVSVGLKGKVSDVRSVLTQALAGVAIKGAVPGLLEDVLGGKKKDR